MLEFSFFRKSSAETSIAIFPLFAKTSNYCKRSNSDFWNTFWFFYHPNFLSVICVSYYYWLELLKTTTTTIKIEQNQKRKKMRKKLYAKFFLSWNDDQPPQPPRPLLFAIVIFVSSSIHVNATKLINVKVNL